MISYDKTEIKKKLTLEQVFELVHEWGGDPQYTDFGFLSATICHNMPGDGSRKLYYYSNSGLFQCYSNCGSFDIFELLIKIAKIQWGKNYDLNDAVRYIAIRFSIAGELKQEEQDDFGDWAVFGQYDRLDSLDVKDYHAELKTYDDSVLSRLNYTAKLTPWLNEGISQKALDVARIGYFPGGGQITIPHYDINGRFIGLRGRDLCKPDAERYGKYRPLIIGLQQYNHPLGLNLYNLNLSKDNIKTTGIAIVFESEKSCLKYKTFFGVDNDISVACCGSNLSFYQVQLLLDCGAKEIVIAFDRQFQTIGDNEFKHLITNLKKINEKYKNYVKISIIFDKNMITGYKDAPIDESKEKFLTLFKERILL